MHRFPILLAVFLSLSAAVILGQEEEEESEQERDIVDVDTCGTLAGKLVTYTARTDVSWSSNPLHEGIEVHHSIAMGRDPDFSELLTWTSEAHPEDIKPFKVKANKQDLRMYFPSGRTPSAGRSSPTASVPKLGINPSAGTRHFPWWYPPTRNGWPMPWKPRMARGWNCGSDG